MLPLYARLSNSEQNRVFQSHRPPHRAGHQRGGNLADGAGHQVRHRSGHRAHQPLQLPHQVQRLPIEPVSQASANQRKGRCGRVSEGVCIRLYSEQDFLSRPAFTDPEILRTNRRRSFCR
ncbi:hypothetical protein M8494_09400 [Serratia ureilytica]